MPALNTLARKSYDATSTYGDRVHILHIYVIEPHPMDPDVSPYSGVVWEAEYSTKSQPTDYSGRVANAADTDVLLEGVQLMLVDDLRPGALDNPAWCTYGPCPNCAYLIRRDGIIDTVQTWVDVDAMESAIDALPP